MKKIKINWGTGIVLAFIGFILFIMFFVIRMNTRKEYDHEMVTEAYYSKELSFDRDMQRERRTLESGMAPEISVDREGLEIVFPERTLSEKISGKVSFYRPSDRSGDFSVALKVSDHRMFIPAAVLLPGRWDLEIDWIYENDSYLSHKKITFRE
ncbi:FixH family protein [Sinomicrobium soli]|uniref:FixH family protein n=1 Tax=Sinomicrobium sp. N-1-3-6 TaxID=2219864 RepID=UPI001374F727|nr:FixH family protein [Sinomicrobium sp. N-1-3-6]